MNRYLFLLHRYLGIALGIVMSVWCLSGIVMMYVQYPALTPEREARSLEALDLSACCALPAELESLEGTALSELRIEMMAGSPVLRLTGSSGERRVIDLSTGKRIDGLGAEDAQAVARAFASVSGIEDFRAEGPLTRDQWTVYGAYNVHRPLYKFAGNDGARTHWYVSSRSGEVVQVTTAYERFWNWLGAVPHWLYPTLLRQHTYLWSQTVIWLTIAGTFLTVLGVYVGIRQIKSRRSGRYSPYRGVALWHHYIGLVFGALTLTWLISGFFSMNPWGLLEGRAFSEEHARQQGSALTLDSQLRQTIATLAETVRSTNTVRLEANSANGERFFVAWDDTGMRHRVSLQYEAAAERSESTALQAASRLRPETDVIEQGWIESDDAYYYSHHDSKPLPVYRIIYADGERFYLDRLTGEIVYAVDTSRRLYRWLHYGLHRGDFVQLMRSRPVWDLFMLPLMIGVSLSALTGTWLGFRRIRRSLTHHAPRETPAELSSMRHSG